jgi:hypothetical protein
MGVADNSLGSDTPGNDHVSLDSLNYVTVDDNNYIYFLHISMPGSSESYLNYRFNYALVEYKFPE